MKTHKIITAVIVTCLALASCTENERARAWGGTTTVDLPPNTKFVVATWKDTQLWYAYRTRRADEKPETVTLQEQSNFGLVEGQVIFTER